MRMLKWISANKYVEAHFGKPKKHGQTKVSKQEKAIEPKWQERMAHGLIKWVLRKQMGLNGIRKRKEANPWAICRKARMGYSRPKVM